MENLTPSSNPDNTEPPFEAPAGLALSPEDQGYQLHHYEERIQAVEAVLSDLTQRLEAVEGGHVLEHVDGIFRLAATLEEVHR